jgi:two-component system, LuxR family, response regulator FixJ
LSKPPVIAIVDDDEAVREALCDLLLVERLCARPFDGAAAFLAEADIDDYDCIVTDVRMPEVDGLELQARLRARGSTIPMIFITSSVDDTTRAQAMRGGAVAWFTKPVADEALLAGLRTALGQSDPAGA